VEPRRTEAMQALTRAAMAVVVGGLLTGLGFFFWWFFDDNTISLGFRATIAVVVVGLIVLLFAVIWDRYRASKTREEQDLKGVKY